MARARGSAANVRASGVHTHLCAQVVHPQLLSRDISVFLDSAALTSDTLPDYLRAIQRLAHVVTYSEACTILMWELHISQRRTSGSVTFRFILPTVRRPHLCYTSHFCPSAHFCVRCSQLK